ncbi:hypothetical protein [Aestuariibaculum suncheonense]|uniref:Uncharacterized protein n=1 Tax=Aestuariibaculum suncheonense TaxID=1028745 RepID=A0A8J6UI90_9FLAO|nr:hypothetical protein [Aestuariibaculum suncheonense]MBD0836339.1 hypothetical protein [Aestuariibaculum suncheonense]
MAVEKDFIKREVEKLILLLTSLIEKVSGINSSNAQRGIEEVNQVLKIQFDLTLKDFTLLDDEDILKRITNMHDSHIDKTIELIYAFVQNSELDGVSEVYDKGTLSAKAILLIDYLNEKSNTFSMKRMSLKKTLQYRI